MTRTELLERRVRDLKQECTKLFEVVQAQGDIIESQDSMIKKLEKDVDDLRNGRVM